MKLTPRRSYEAKFCSFLRFDNDASLLMRWLTDNRLVRNFNSYLTDSPSEGFILKQLYHSLQKDPDHSLAHYHLCAYLQESCYWVAYRFANSHNLGNLSFTDGFLKVFKIAEAETLNSEKLLHRLHQYDPQRSQFKTYAQTWLKSAIADAIYSEYQVGKYSDWGLLKNTSAKALKDALTQKGYSHQQIQTYQTSWEFFRNISSSNPPKKEELETITTLYNQHVAEAISVAELEQLLKQCSQAVRDYKTQQRPHNSARPLPGEQDEQDHPTSFRLPKALTTPPPSLEDSLSSETLNELFSDALERFNSQEIKLLLLAYGLNFQQSQIANLQKVNQSSIQRKLKRLNKRMIEILMEELTEQKKVNIHFNSSWFQQINVTIQHWLETQFKQPLFNQLAHVFQNQLTVSTQNSFRLLYGGTYGGTYDGKSPSSLTLEETSQQLAIPMAELKTQFEQSKQLLKEGIITILNQQGIDEISTENPKLTELVEEWLTNHAIYSLLISAK